MIKSKCKIISVVLNLLLTVFVFNDADVSLLRLNVNQSVNEGSGFSDNRESGYVATPFDDEDVPRTVVKDIQSSGDGFPQLAKVYKRVKPYTMTRSTATILVDIAFEHSYKSYMLPGASMTSQLQSFHNDIIENLKIELNNINGVFEHKILSIRPGPLIPKKSKKSAIINVPSVFIRINITQKNSSFVNPIIIFHMSECGRRGSFGNLTIADQVLFPQFVCTKNQVYCWPYCRTGAYCDGISDCPDTKLDETESCPKCLVKHVNLIVTSQVLNEDDQLSIICNSSKKCGEYKKSIRWNFPAELKQYEGLYNGIERVEFLPKHLITSGRYSCSIEGEFSSTNISVIKKPTVLLTKADKDAETVIITEIEGRNVEYWCNTSDGFATWLPVTIAGVNIINYNERCSKISFNEITKRMSNTYYCHVLWGYKENKSIKKSVKIVILCDVKYHFECKYQTMKRSCIPLKYKCDNIKQCEDGSDEKDCNFCSEKDLSVDIGTNVIKDVGDTIIMECLTTKVTCNPLFWWYGGEIISNGGNIARFKDTLFIVNLRRYNSGVFQCSDNSNRTFIDVSVHINQAPKLQLWPHLQMINITYGQSNTVDCSIEYPVNVTYQKKLPHWTKANQTIIHKNVEIITKGGSLTTLHVKDAQLEMSGVYYCEVSWGVMNNKVVRVPILITINQLICKNGEKICEDKKICLANNLWCDGKKQCQDGSDERLCDSCIHGFVFVQPSSVVAFVGETIELHCYYDKTCYPVRWRIKGQEYPLYNVDGINIDNNKLVIMKAKSLQSNVYECYSGSKMFQSNVTVIKEVMLKLSSSYIFLDYGKDINIDCESNYGTPQWRRRDLKPLSEIKGAHQSHPNAKSAKLSIRSSSYDSRGYYMCFVRLSKSVEDAASSLMFIHIIELKCTRDSLLCDGKTNCIPKNKTCDFKIDCQDGSDERNCSTCNGTFEIQPKELVVTKFGYGVFHCLVPKKECLPIEWKFKSGKPLKDPRFYKFNTSLYTFSPKVSDAGEVMCMFRQISSSAVLIVKDLILTFEPNQSDNSIIYMLQGQSRQISCKSNLGQPRWIYPEENSVSSFGVRYRNYEENMSVLDIVNIQIGASRKYVCHVMFSRESKKISLSIKVI